MIQQAFVLAGGAGTRLRPYTDHVPKPLLQVGGKPILEWQFKWLAKNGVKRVLLAVGYKAEQVIEFVEGGNWMQEIDFIREETPLGTAGGLKLAAKELDENFFMVNGDQITNLNLAEMGEFHLQKGNLATLYVHPLEDVSGYGVVEMKGDKIIRFVEKPAPEEAPSNLISGGIYALKKKILEFIPKGKCSIEREVFPKLAEKRELNGFVSRKMVYWTGNDSVEDLRKTDEYLRFGVVKI